MPPARFVSNEIYNRHRGISKFMVFYTDSGNLFSRISQIYPTVSLCVDANKA